MEKEHWADHRVVLVPSYVNKQYPLTVGEVPGALRVLLYKFYLSPEQSLLSFRGCSNPLIDVCLDSPSCVRVRRLAMVRIPAVDEIAARDVVRERGAT
jgi:hypothetical protein